MSLEECKRIAEEKREKLEALQKGRRHSRGEVEGEKVDVYFSKNPLPLFLESHQPWVVFVSAYGQLSYKYFNKKKPAEDYFEELTQKYGLQEADG